MFKRIITKLFWLSRSMLLHFLDTLIKVFLADATDSLSSLKSLVMELFLTLLILLKSMQSLTF